MVRKDDINSSKGYLLCDKCGGYYELQPGESPDDFEECECGGNLRYSKINPVKNESKGSITQKFPQNDLKSLISQNKKKSLIIICVLAIIITIPLILYVNQQTNIKYTLLGSYDAENIDYTLVHIPQGTKSIKIEYNISWNATSAGTNAFELHAYNINSGDRVPTGTLNLTNNKGFSIYEGQNKSGTYYFNNPQIKTLVLNGNGIKGTINIYTAQ
ncbi:hypothetical protein Metbo_1139 [Methanobacterium lacus]|uniref:Uncharacterized protein n=1 Tax=Methanobacterium lacus (strain AL-21) TaxID=877455 RepID=F0T5Z0_METLA|nr:hypothetical protein [Methanobacterium lacus]ADZ09383.1 hypothetical protein Metbo_1139 [Methanobacterium lacus]